jgi:hypothetical protein
MRTALLLLQLFLLSEFLLSMLPCDMHMWFQVCSLVSTATMHQQALASAVAASNYGRLAAPLLQS